MRERIRSRVAARPHSPALVIGFVEDIQVVFQGAHPRLHLFLLRARQKADSSPTGMVTRVMMISESTFTPASA